MICSVCGKNKYNEIFFLSKINVFICSTCKAIKDSTKFYIGGKEVSREDYDKFLDAGIIPE